MAMRLLTAAIATIQTAQSPKPVIAIVSCTRKHASELGPVLLSLNKHSPGARVLLFIDEDNRRAISGCKGRLARSLRLEVVPVEALGAELPDYNATGKRQASKFTCAAAKLLLQGAPALRDAEFVLAMDVDTVVLEPLSGLWSWTAEMRRTEALWAMVREHSVGASDDVSVRRAPRAASADPNAYFNTGVMLIHAARLRARGLLHPSTLLSQLSPAVRGGRGYLDFGLGDQNLLNAWLSERQDEIIELPCRWNRRVDSACHESAGPGIEHANRNVGKPYTLMADRMRLSEIMSELLQSPNVIKAMVDESNATRLAAACDELGREQRKLSSECTVLVERLRQRQAIRPFHDEYSLLPCRALSSTSEQAINTSSSDDGSTHGSAQSSAHGSAQAWIGECLTGAVTCRRHSSCDSTIDYPLSCLTSHIGAWVATTARVQCCLRCCMMYWVRRLGLEANAQHWQRMRKRFDISSGTGGPEAEGEAALTRRVSSAGSSSNAAGDSLPLDSVLLFRFSMARFAHVQALTLSDWTALVADDVDITSPRFSTPSAATSPSAIVCLNGFGRIMGTRKAAALNATAAGAASLLRANRTGLMHATSPPGRERILFADPLHKIVHGALAPGGRHAFLYGDDSSLSGWLLEKLRVQLGNSLGAYFAPNLSPEALRMQAGDHPYAIAVPLGLNRNARPLAATMHVGGLLDPDSGAVGPRQTSRAARKNSLLCCCMRPYEHRVAIARQLARNGFDCSSVLGTEGSTGATRSFEATLELYSEHRFVLDLMGKGRQDFRIWEILLAGAVPVLEHFEEHNALLDGLPVVRVANWSELTPARLNSEWLRIRRAAREGTVSWTKLYLPFWLHTFVAHMQDAYRERGQIASST